MLFKSVRLGFARALLVFVAVLSLSSHECHGTAAGALLTDVGESIDHAKALEYESTVTITDSHGTAHTLYVHMKLRKPNLFIATFSAKVWDDVASDQVVSNSTAVYEYDPNKNMFSVSPPFAQSNSIKQDFVNAGGLVFRVAAQFLSSNAQPFANLLPQDADHVLSLSRRAMDMPGAQVITSTGAGGSDSENVAKLWVGNNDSLPKRLVLSVLQNGQESISYEQDWHHFTVDPSFPDSEFTPNIPATANKWSPDANAQPTSGEVSVDLSAYFNSIGIYRDGTHFLMNGAMGSTAGFSSNLLGSGVTWNGSSFKLGPPSADNAVESLGQVINLPSGHFSHLDILAACPFTSQPSQQFVVEYADTTESRITQGVSSYASTQQFPGESVSVTMAYVDYNDGTSGPCKHRDTNGSGQVLLLPAHLYGYEFPLDNSKSTLAVLLPRNVNVYVFAMVLTP